MRKSMALVAGLVLFLVGAQSRGAGDEAKGNSSKTATAGEIAKLIGQLGAESHKDRLTAEDALVKIGKPAVGPLQKAVAGDDEEQAKRARAALVRIRMPETIRTLAEQLNKAGLAPGSTFRPRPEYLEIIDKLVECGNGEACDVLLKFIQAQDGDRLLRKYAVCALGRIGTPDALKCLAGFHAWADERIATRDREFRFCAWDRPIEHYAGDELKPWLTGKDANGVEWSAFVWGRFAYDQVWLTRPLGEGKWLTPVLTDLERGDLVKRKDLALEVAASGPRIKSADGKTDIRLAMLGADSDKDELSDAAEKVFGTNPAKADTDGDDIPDGKDADPTAAAGPAPTESDMICQAVFYAMFSTCDAWEPIYMPKGGQAFRGYRGGIVRTDKQVIGRVNVYFKAPQIDGDTAVVAFGDYEGPESRAYYHTTLKKTSGMWVVISIQMLMMS